MRRKDYLRNAANLTYLIQENDLDHHQNAAAADSSSVRRRCGIGGWRKTSPKPRFTGRTGSVLPGEGDFQTGPILDHLARLGYEGYASLEVLNPQLWQIAADRVADLGYQALCRTLGRWCAAPGAPGGTGTGMGGP